MVRHVVIDTLLAAILGGILWLAGCAHVASLRITASLSPPSVDVQVQDASSTTRPAP